MADGAVHEHVLISSHHDPVLTRSTVAIVGFAADDRPLVPWEDDTVEIWGLNMGHGWMPRWDRLFEMHPKSEVARETAVLKRDVDHLGVLMAEQKRPIYMLEEHVDIPCSVRFPLPEFQRFFGQSCEKLRHQAYVTSTFGYMLGLAIMRLSGRPNAEIQVYGVPLVNGDEYAYQRENASFFAGYALGHGIRLTLTPWATWLEADGLYGYTHAESIELLAALHDGCLAESKKYADEIKDLDAQMAAIQRKVNTKDGARQQAEVMAKRLTAIMRGAKIA